MMKPLALPVKCAPSKLRTGPSATLPWTYAGLDDSVPADRTFMLTANNAWGAVSVWLTMTINPVMAGYVDTAALASELGMTETCVKAIRAFAAKPELADSFSAVANAFRAISTQDDYPPKFCPNLVGVICRMKFVKTMALDPMTPEEQKAFLAAKKVRQAAAAKAAKKKA
jgi:hypothetical protein